MRLNDVINDKDLNKYLNCVMFKGYKHYCCEKYYNYEEYKQEIYVYLLEKLVKFDSSLSSINSYLYNCVMTRALNLMRNKTCKQRGYGYTTVSANVSYLNSNGKSETNLLIETLEDEQNVENEVLSNVCGESELIEYLLSKHKNEKYYEDIIKLLCKGYSKTKIANTIGKSRTVVDKRLEVITKDIINFRSDVNV